MVESAETRYSGFTKLDSSNLLVPEEGKIADRDLVVKFLGADYQSFVQQDVSSQGIIPEGHRLTFFEFPTRHIYKLKDNAVIISGSLNLVEEYIDGDKIIVSLLLPFSASSRHHHEAPMGNEEYRRIIGASKIDLDKKIVDFNERQAYIEVKRNVVHQGKTTNDFMLTSIVMRGAALVSPEKLHISDMEIGK